MVSAAFAQSIVVLTDTWPQTHITEGSAKIYGSPAETTDTLEKGAQAELMNFPGSNTVIIRSDSELFNVVRFGTSVLFEGVGGTVLKIPATKDVQTISFEDVDYELSIPDSRVMLGDQEVPLDYGNNPPGGRCHIPDGGPECPCGPPKTPQYVVDIILSIKKEHPEYSPGLISRMIKFQLEIFIHKKQFRPFSRKMGTLPILRAGYILPSRNLPGRPCSTTRLLPL
jgi:hypothetical protein